MRPVVRRFTEWASTSRIFPAMTDLLAVVKPEVTRLLILIFLWVHACSTSSRLPAEILSTAATRRQGITTRAWR